MEVKGFLTALKNTGAQKMKGRALKVCSQSERGTITQQFGFLIGLDQQKITKVIFIATKQKFDRQIFSDYQNSTRNQPSLQVLRGLAEGQAWLAGTSERSDQVPFLKRPLSLRPKQPPKPKKGLRRSVTRN